MKNNTKIPLLEQFQNQLSKLIPLAHKYITTHFLALYRHSNKSGGVTLIV